MQSWVVLYIRGPALPLLSAASQPGNTKASRLLWLREVLGKLWIKDSRKQVITHSWQPSKAQTLQDQLGEKAVCNRGSLVYLYLCWSKKWSTEVQGLKSAFPGREVLAAVFLGCEDLASKPPAYGAQAEQPSHVRLGHCRAETALLEWSKVLAKQLPKTAGWGRNK